MKKSQGTSYLDWLAELERIHPPPEGAKTNPEYWDFLYDEDRTPQEAVDYINGLPKGVILVTNPKNL